MLLSRITAITMISQIKIIVRVAFHNFAYFSGILWRFLAKYRPQWWHRDWQQKKTKYYLPWICRLRSPFTKVGVFMIFTTDFYQTVIAMMAMWSVTKMSYQLIILVKVTIYKNHYISAIILPILTNLSPKWCHLGWQQKGDIIWPSKCGARSHFTE